jgi:hypothetical protein
MLGAFGSGVGGVGYDADLADGRVIPARNMAS